MRALVLELLAVTDPEPYGRLIVRESCPDDENGRGLLLDALALRWGVQQEPGGGPGTAGRPCGARFREVRTPTSR
ncbi:MULTISPECIES: hypothetical protein [unclassified Streptomyces]|uniref:hypothetical protein n=1 Tax=unclassified Streptomyces TaxID=2593676 RepID=UPI0037F9F26A